MNNPTRSLFIRFALLSAAVITGFALYQVNHVRAAGGPMEESHSYYRVLAPIESGNLLLFPVVQAGKTHASPFLTLDEGIKSGQVEVTEAGKVRGLVRPRPPARSNPSGQVLPYRTPGPAYNRGDQVNTLVLVNNSDKPLLLLAGEIVTGTA